MSIRNNITLIGNVGQLPTTKTLPSGVRLIEFSLATNETYRNRDGEKVTRTEWHRIKAFGKVVDVLEAYLTKGSQIALTGTLRYNKWTDKYEQSRISAEIILNEFTFLGSKDRNTEAVATEDAHLEMQTAEPTPAKSGKRGGNKTSTPATKATAAEDLPF